MLRSAMYRFIFVALLLLIAARVSAVQIGDTLEQVAAERGKPSSEMNAGTTKILNYPDQTIKLKDGKVVEVSEVVPSAPPPAEAEKRTKETIKAGSWTVDAHAAIAQAKRENRRVLLLFTGSDWSAFSQRFYKEVLSTPEFGKYAVENLILVMVDFPKTLNQSEALKAQNQKLLKVCKVERFPTVVLLNSAGKTLGMIPFEEGGVAKFLDSLKKL